MSSARSAAEWRDFLVAHMPPGEDALDLRSGSLIYRSLEALAIELARSDAALEQLLLELDPTQTTELVTDWERLLALPRSCQTAPTTLALRRALIVALITRGADLSPATLIEAAAVYGFTITIREYFPESVPGDLPLSNSHKYDVTVAGEVEVVPFMTGSAQSGDPLGKVEQTDLACLLDEIEPAYAERQILS